MVTKKDVIAYFKYKLAVNRGWAVRGLLQLYSHQTEGEQQLQATVIDNGVGFTGVDAEYLTSLAQQYQRTQWLSPLQMQHLHKKMPKYAKQLLGYVEQVNPDYRSTLDPKKVEVVLPKSTLDIFT